jgi:hypothetical protein
VHQTITPAGRSPFPEDTANDLVYEIDLKYTPCKEQREKKKKKKKTPAKKKKKKK